MKPTVFRSKFALVVAYVWFAFAFVNAVDLVLRGRDAYALLGGAILLAFTVAIYLTCFRPRIVAGDEGVQVHNPFRDAFIPWSAVDDITVSHSIRISAGETVVRSWTPQTSSKERRQALRKGVATKPGLKERDAESFRGVTHADWVARQLSEFAVSRRPKKGDTAAAKVAWSPVAVGLSLASLALLAVSIVAVLV
ncbi:PH domain-containing protein [Rhizohabitans arisaemae]|uniref:PH domain-containing protein n=1 Tax=Rhizohabitans arisaemae TaxID=2720610 RepID=UPI0024B1D2D9|nr:PH domain-containing protein [Rhizohabitans arisaemae]